MKFSIMKAHVGDIDDLQKSDFIYEPKLDGIRAICYVNKKMSFFSRNEKDLTANFPEFDFRKNINAKDCVLDGEIIAYDKNGNPSFNLLQTGGEATYVVFDILSKNGKSLINKPLIERKKILDETVQESDHLEKIFFTEKGNALWKIIVKRGLEGVIAKYNQSRYYPSKRTYEWLKIKSLNTIDCVIVGFTTGKREISSLVLALYWNDKELHYTGKVGTGFNKQIFHNLMNKFKTLHTTSSPFNEYVKIKNINWLKPKLVCEIQYLEMTKNNYLRAPVFLRLRTDKKPQECTLESQIF